MATLPHVAAPHAQTYIRADAVAILATGSAANAGVATKAIASGALIDLKILLT